MSENLRLLGRYSAAMESGDGDSGVRPTIGQWPDLTLATWSDTRDTLHMWTQIVGKVRLALEPMVNHWWQVTLYVSARGLTTSLMHCARSGLELEFDFVDHVLRVRTSDGGAREVALEPRTVAELLRRRRWPRSTSSACTCRSSPDPVEVVEAIPFAGRHRGAPTTPTAAHRFWTRARADRTG